jgi:hypothetical protein
MVSIHWGNTAAEAQNFFSRMNDFVRKPLYFADSMFSNVLLLMRHDKLLFPTSKDQESPKQLEPAKQDKDLKEFNLRIDDTFRRQLVIEKGTEIPRTHSFEYRLSELTTSQREKLMGSFFNPSHSALPAKMTLYLPSFNKHTKQILFNDLAWFAKLDALASTPVDIFQSWEDDFEEARAKAKGLEVLETGSEQHPSE